MHPEIKQDQEKHAREVEDSEEAKEVQQKLEAYGSQLSKEGKPEGGQHDDTDLGLRRSTRQVKRSERQKLADEQPGPRELTKSESSSNNPSTSTAKTTRIDGGDKGERGNVEYDDKGGEVPATRPKRAANKKGKGKRVAASSDINEEEEEEEDRPSSIAKKSARTMRKTRKVPSLIKDVQVKADSEEKGITKGGKQKASKAEYKVYDLDTVLTSVKSPLVNLDILESILNTRTWNTLSEGKRAHLRTLLPTTAFGIVPQTLDRYHPARRGEERVSAKARDDEEVTKQRDLALAVGEHALDLSFFSDPHFESAAKTFQDHLFSGWMTRKHCTLVERYLRDVHDGTAHAQWKDETWDRDHPPSPDSVDKGVNDNDANNESDPSRFFNLGRKGKKEESELLHLIQKGFLQKGDIIAFKHKFVAHDLTIEKDALITDTNTKAGTLNLQAITGPQRDLTPGLLLPEPSLSGWSSSSGPSMILREMTVNAAHLLASALLDLDGRIPRDGRARFDAWRALTVWRWPSDGSNGVDKEDLTEEVVALLERGGREVLGTMHYLRGVAFD